MAANTLMQTLVAAIAHQVAAELGGEALYSWVFSIYLLASTVTIPFFSKIADSYGYKNIFMIGMSVFLVGTLLCGLAASMPLLIIARLIQGLGAGALGPVTIAMIGYMYTLEERGRVMGIFAATQLLSNIAGPLIGGAVAQSYSWNWTFFMVIPFGLASMLLIYGMQQDKSRGSFSLKQMDVLGAILLGSAVAIIVQAMTRIGQFGMDGLTVAMSGVSIALLIWFVFQERKHPDPVLPPRLIRIPNVRLANMSAFLVGLFMYGSIAILPMYAAAMLGGGTLNSGKVLIPLMVGMGVGVIASGMLMKKLSYRTIAQFGWLLSCTSLITLGLMSLANTFTGWSMTAIGFAGFGAGVLLPTFLLPAQNAVSRNEQAVVGGLVQLSRNLGGAVGIPVLTIIPAMTGAVHAASGAGYGMVFLFLAAVTVIGWLVGMQYKGSVREEVEAL